MQKKAWTDSELMEEILRTLNKKCAAENHKILSFIDNAPSHPESFIDCFANVKIVFFPMNTTSKLQTRDIGIIKYFKVFYRKQLLQHALARIKPGSKASNVVSSVDLLKSIGWVMDAWRKVKKETIVIVLLSVVSTKLPLSYSKMMTLMLNLQNCKITSQRYLLIQRLTLT